MNLGLAYLAVSAVVTLIVEILRERLSFLDGRLVNLVAWAVGVGATYTPIPAFAGLADLEARLAAGLLLAGGASLIAELKGLLKNSRELKKAALEELGKAEEAYQAPAAYRADEGYNADDPVKAS